ncbi:MAG: hypothetical protein ACRD3G_30555 [Vicinamibacterales bacterium]
MRFLIAYLLQLAALTTQAAPPPESPRPLSFQATLDAIRIIARPGQVATRQFRLTLDRDQQPTQFKARVEDWWRSPDGKQSFYAAAGTLRRSCGQWVSINPVESTVKPGDTLTIRITVTMPVEVQSGGFWCALTVDEVPDPLEAAGEGVGVRFVASVSTGIFVHVEPVQREAAILGIRLDGDEARVQVRNDGNAPLAVEGRVEFFAPESTTPLATSDLGRRTVLTEPSREVMLTAKIPPARVLPSGRYRVRAVLDFGADHYIGAERELDLVREEVQERAAVP